MSTENNTSPAGHAAPEIEAGLITLDPSAGLITTINTYTVTPERAEEVLEYLAGCGKTAVLKEIRNPNYAAFKTAAVRTAFKAHKCL